ncbi:MAG: DUF2277 domain-containing protein [Chloroflexota bacterium]|nr:DUF2277 domain-containing protein [Chloroflexota bacterium]
MCRSIRTLRTPTPATEEEVRAAALQFVRKVSGFRAPAPKNAEAFDAAVEEISTATTRLLGRLPASKAMNQHPARPNGVRPSTPH